MIEKNKYYLCIKPFVHENEPASFRNDNNAFVGSIYFSYSYSTSSNSWGDSGYLKSLPPLFTVGKIYYCGSDGKLQDDNYNHVEVKEDNYDTFMCFDADMPADAQALIDKFRSKGIRMLVRPISTLKEGRANNGEITLDDIDIIYEINMHSTEPFNFFVFSYAKDSNIINGIMTCWKKLRTGSPIVKRIINCLRYKELKGDYRARYLGI